MSLRVGFVGPLCLLVLLGLSASLQEASAQKVSVRSFSLDTRYFVRPNSNIALGRFGIDMANLTTLPADWIGPGDGARAVARGVSVLLGSFYLGEAFSLAYHEFGHGTRNAAVGFGSLYGFGTLRSPQDAEVARAGGGTSRNIFGYYFRSIFAGNGGFTLRTTTDAPFSPFSDDQLQELAWDGLRRAGGMNNEMFYTELIEDEIYRNGGHAGFFSSYIKGKLSASAASSSASEFGDINRVVSFYQSQGLSIDRDDIDAMSRRAFLLSALTYQITFRTAAIFTGKSFRFQPWTVRGVQLPNTSFYMNRSGLSLKVRSALQVGTWRVPIALERVVEGRERSEYSVGLHKFTENARFVVDAVLGRRIDLNLEASVRLATWYRVLAGVTVLDERNLNGARLIPSLANGSTYRGFHLGASLLYGGGSH